MNKKVKALWLKALRSGKYKQGRGMLKTSDRKYCCLGVLADLYRKEKRGKWVEIGDGSFTFDGVRAYPSSNVCVWAGLGSSNPEIKGLNLSTYNDVRKYSQIFI